MAKSAKVYQWYGGLQTPRRQWPSLLLAIGFGLLASAPVLAFLVWVYYGDRFRY